MNTNLIMKYSFIFLFFSSLVNAQTDTIGFEQSKITKSEFLNVIKDIIFRQPTDSNVHQLINNGNCVLYLNNVVLANSFLGTILNLDKEEKKIINGFYASVSTQQGKSNRLIKLKKKDFKRLQNLISGTEPDYSYYKLNNFSIHNEAELIIWYKNREIVGGIYITGIPKYSDTAIEKNFFLKLRELILQLNPPKRLGSVSE